MGGLWKFLWDGPLTKPHVTDVPAREGLSMLWKAPGLLLLLLEGPFLQGVLGGCTPAGSGGSGVPRETWSFPPSPGACLRAGLSQQSLLVQRCWGSGLHARGTWYRERGTI